MKWSTIEQVRPSGLVLTTLLLVLFVSNVFLENQWTLTCTFTTQTFPCLLVTMACSFGHICFSIFFDRNGIILQYSQMSDLLGSISDFEDFVVLI